MRPEIPNEESIRIRSRQVWLAAAGSLPAANPLRALSPESVTPLLRRPDLHTRVYAIREEQLHALRRCRETSRSTARKADALIPLQIPNHDDRCGRAFGSDSETKELAIRLFRL